MGDQLLEVNGVSFRALTREHAVLNLMSLPIGGEVCIVAQSKPRHYESILERGTGDSFYIRTHFKREPAQSHELGFKKGQGKVYFYKIPRMAKIWKFTPTGYVTN